MKAPARPCVVCVKTKVVFAQDQQCCPRCVGRVRSAIVETVELFKQLRWELVDRSGTARPLEPSGVRGDTDQLPGGDVLVLLGPGSQFWRSPEQVDSVAGVLHRWANNWREELDLSVKLRTQPVEDSSRFLLDNLGRVMHRGQVATVREFARDVTRLRGAVATVIREGYPWETSAVGCPECGSSLFKPYAKPDRCPRGCTHAGHGHDQGGRRDHWVCRNPSCRRRVEAAEYWLAMRERMEARCADGGGAGGDSRGDPARDADGARTARHPAHG